MPIMNRAAPGPVPNARGGCLLGPDDFGMQPQTQVGVGVHPDEGAVPVVLQEIPRASPPLGTDHLPDDEFSALGRLLVSEQGDMAVKFGDQSVQRHASFVLAVPHRSISMVAGTLCDRCRRRPEGIVLTHE